MKLVKSNKPFVSPSVPDLALDVYYDAEIGDLNADNMLVYFRDACQYLEVWDHNENRPSRQSRIFLSEMKEGEDYLRVDGNLISRQLSHGGNRKPVAILTYYGFFGLVTKTNKITKKAEKIMKDFARYLAEIQAYGFTAKDEVLNRMVDDPDLIIRMATKLKEERAARKLAESQRDEVRATSARMVRNIIRGLEPLYGFPICKLVYRLLRDKGVYNKGCCYVLKNWGDLFCFMSVRCEDGSLDAESALCAREGKVDEVRDFIVDLLAECEINQFTSDSKLKKVA